MKLETVNILSALRAANEWAANYPLQGEASNMDAMASEQVYKETSEALSTAELGFDREELKRLIIESLKYDLTRPDNPRIWLELRQALDYAEAGQYMRAERVLK